jgi:hypothetical protein
MSARILSVGHAAAPTIARSKRSNLRRRARRETLTRIGQALPQKEESSQSRCHRRTFRVIRAHPRRICGLNAKPSHVERGQEHQGQ